MSNQSQLLHFLRLFICTYLNVLHTFYTSYRDVHLSKPKLTWSYSSLSRTPPNRSRITSALHFSSRAAVVPITSTHRHVVIDFALYNRFIIGWAFLFKSIIDRSFWVSELGVKIPKWLVVWNESVDVILIGLRPGVIKWWKYWAICFEKIWKVFL